MDRILVFISYSSEDKKGAGLLKAYFESYCGFDCFLAHEDISISQKWEEQIIKALSQTDIFIPLISNSSFYSSYVNQEIGFALACKKPIFPLKLSQINPFGFISRLQALSYYSNSFSSLLTLISKIFITLIKDNSFSYLKIRVLNSVIYSLCHSSSFKSSRIIMNLIMTSCSSGVRIFTNYQLKQMEYSIEQNPQVYNEMFILSKFRKFIKTID